MKWAYTMHSEESSVSQVGKYDLLDLVSQVFLVSQVCGLVRQVGRHVRKLDKNVEKL